MTNSRHSMNHEPPFRDLAAATARVLWLRLRYKFAKWLVTLAWVFWFFMAKRTATRLCQASRKVAPPM